MKQGYYVFALGAYRLMDFPYYGWRLVYFHPSQKAHGSSKRIVFKTHGDIARPKGIYLRRGNNINRGIYLPPEAGKDFLYSNMYANILAGWYALRPAGASHSLSPV